MKPQNRSKTGKRKPTSTSWGKGQSGNPGGRPKLTEAQKAAREARAAAQPAAVARLVSIIDNPESKDQDAIAASKVILEGLEPMKLELDATVKGHVTTATKLPPVDPKRLERIAAVLQRAGTLPAQAKPDGEKPE